MKKSSIVLYLFLVTILGFVAVKANFNPQVFKNIKFEKPEVKFDFNINDKKDKNVSDEEGINSSLDMKEPVLSYTDLSLNGKTKDIFSVYPDEKNGQIEYKKMYKLRTNGKCGLLNQNGQKITKIIYDDFSDFDRNQGIYQSRLKGKIGLMNYKGRILIPTKYEVIEKTQYSKICKARNHSRYALYDIQKPKQIVSAIYNKITSLDEHNWKLTFGKKVGLVYYKNGKSVIIKPIYNDIENENYYLKSVLKNKVGIIDKYSGIVIIEPIYEDVELINAKDAISNGLLVFKTEVEGRYGLIYYSSKSALVIPPIYSDVKYNGVVNVLSGDTWLVLDNTGNIISNAKSIFSHEF